MTPETLREAIQEAERFIRVAKQVEFKPRRIKGGPAWPESTISTAAAKRASMDLTRALARMRRYE